MSKQITTVVELAANKYPLIHPDIDDYENDECILQRAAFIEGYQAANAAVQGYREALEKIETMDYDTTARYCIDIAQQALSKAEDKGDNGWISVEDRLPEYGKFILVIGTDDKQYGIERCHVCEMNDLEDGIEFKQTRRFYWLTESGRKIDKVTHWLPLPPKP